MNTGQVTFVVNLLQDINIHRPLVMLAAHELKLAIRFLVTTAFRKRDKTGLWQQELDDIANATHSAIYDFGNEYQALQVLQGGHGALIAASESHLDAHKPVHDLFRIAPSQYVRITLQHGYECVGFLQSREQNLAHGANITFAADIICGWCAPERLTAVTRSQRHKLWVTGPTSRLSRPRSHQDNAAPAAAARQPIGLVCENMHSPRLNVTGDFKSQFIEIFEMFSAELAREGRQVALRPHPGGQYVIKNNVTLPDNAILENSPIYKVDLTCFAYGISAPSSILVDMVLAGIPTAVWQDEGSVMDLGNYEGLTRVSNLDDWRAFSRNAIERPDEFTSKQNEFLERQRLLIEPTSVHQAFSTLLLVATKTTTWVSTRVSTSTAERILIVAPAYIPTLQLSFVKPLTLDIATNNIAIDVILENDLGSEFKSEDVFTLEARDWLKARIDAFRPTVAIFCRWAGPHTAWLLNYFASQHIPTIFHLDDDLLAIPKEIGLEKWEFHNRPERLASIRQLLDRASLIYCSTLPLKKRMAAINSKAPIRAGQIYCSAMPLTVPKTRPVRKIGYMGIGHEGDFDTVLPAICRYLRKNPQVSFEIFGTIPIPQAFAEFRERVTHAPKIDSYEKFLHALALYEWDIGICPLQNIPFNLLKANTKWVEYTAVGVAVIASRDTVYNQCCADGCGILANTEDEWLAALEYLTQHPQARAEMVSRAQARLRQEYSPNRLREQVFSMIAVARANLRDSLPLPDNSTRPSVADRQERILFIAHSYLPTLQISFIRPLLPMVAQGDIETDILTDKQIGRKRWQHVGYSSAQQWLIARFTKHPPSVMLFCRYNGAYAETLLELANRHAIPVIYHIDDDLLSIPKDIGDEKFEFHNNEKRLATVRLLLQKSTLVYASTIKLENHLKTFYPKARIVSGKIYCAGQPMNRPTLRPVKKIGYMASADHAHNMTHILGALVKLLRKHTGLKFEFFGKIPSPQEFNEFGERITYAPAIINYESFLRKFAEYNWDIGICPLTPIHFNMMKANTKWVEYTSVGAAVVASKGTAYDECCADGCGLLAETEDEWFQALDKLISDPEERYLQVLRAQEKLTQEYSIDRLREQVLAIFAKAHQLSSGSPRQT